MAEARSVMAVFVFLSTLGGGYAAEVDTDIAKCATVKGDLDRLACFDDLATRHKLDGPQPIPVETQGTGKWRVSRDKNPVDDSETVTAMLTADDVKSRWGEPISLVARCKSNKTEVYIVWNDYLGDDSNDVYSDWKLVTVRIGNGKAQEQRWGLSTDSKATFAPDWAGALLKSMLSASDFLAQTTPYNESPVTAVFDTRGMSEAISPIASVCGWSLAD